MTPSESVHSEAAEIAALLAAATANHAAGNISQALDEYQQVLKVDPDCVNALLLLGILLADRSEFQKAEALFHRYLRLVPDDAPAIHALGKVRQAQGDDTDAIAWFVKALDVNPRHTPAANDLGVSYHRTGRLKEACAAFTQATELDGAWALAWYNLGTAQFDIGGLEQAEHAYRQAIALDADYSDAYNMLAATLERRHRLKEAEACVDTFARLKPVIHRPCTGAHPGTKVLLVAAAGMCNFRSDFLFDLRRYETTTVFVRAPANASHKSLLPLLPPIDLVFSTIADADRAEPFLKESLALCHSLGRPVLNPPDNRIARTRRDIMAQLLAQNPGTVVPVTRRIDAAGMNQVMEHAPGTPFLVRACGTHGGRDLVRIDRTSDLQPFMEATPSTAYYVSDYHDYRSADGYFRKYRFIFVDREVYPYHLAISGDWLVHYFRTEMAEHPWMQREEEAFLADYKQVFSGMLGEAVRSVAKTLDLDFAGMDCSITPDGRLLVFESNASMLVHLDDPAETFPYKHQYVPRIFEAIDRMVARHVG